MIRKRVLLIAVPVTVLLIFAIFLRNKKGPEKLAPTVAAGPSVIQKDPSADKVGAADGTAPTASLSEPAKQSLSKPWKSLDPSIRLLCGISLDPNLPKGMSYVNLKAYLSTKSEMFALDQDTCQSLMRTVDTVALMDHCLVKYLGIGADFKTIGEGQVDLAGDRTSAINKLQSLLTDKPKEEWTTLEGTLSWPGYELEDATKGFQIRALLLAGELQGEDSASNGLRSILERYVMSEDPEIAVAAALGLAKRGSDKYLVDMLVGDSEEKRNLASAGLRWGALAASSLPSVKWEFNVLGPRSDSTELRSTLIKLADSGDLSSPAGLNSVYALMQRSAEPDALDAVRKLFVRSTNEKVLIGLLLDNSAYHLAADPLCCDRLKVLSVSDNPTISTTSLLRLGASENPGDVVFLLTRLQDKDQRNVRSAIAALGVNGILLPDQVLSALREFRKNSKDPELRKQCQRSLQLIEDRLTR